MIRDDLPGTAPELPDGLIEEFILCQDEFTNLPCHCGGVAETWGNGVSDICRRCLEKWLDAGEPVVCPCTEEVAA